MSHNIELHFVLDVFEVAVVVRAKIYDVGCNLGGYCCQADPCTRALLIS